MVKIRFIEHDGANHDVVVNPGVSLMEAAKRNGVVSIEGECGGARACATCHIYIPNEWRHLTGQASEDEQMMLEFGVDVDERSRLGCQIIVTPQMDGMTILTPRCQR
ncbi:2Fe-2S iron-sulfur cluster-binding protein [Bradyrhizobium liaoningense]